MSPPGAAPARVDRRAVLLGALAAGSGGLLLALAGSAGLGSGAWFPLLTLWIVLLVAGTKLARRVAARLRGRRA